MSRYKGIIFDMDGVIVHSNPAHKEAIDVFLKEYDKNISEEYLRENVYGTSNRYWLPKVFVNIGDKEIKRLGDEKEALFRELFEPQSHVVKGFLEFLDEVVSQPVKLAVATSAPADNADYILGELKIRHYFDTVLNSSHVSHGKPDPEIYLRTAENLRVKPEECIVFEDSKAGVQSAWKAGCIVVGVATTHSREELADCDLIITDFTDISFDTLQTLLKESSLNN